MQCETRNFLQNVVQNRSFAFNKRCDFIFKHLIPEELNYYQSAVLNSRLCRLRLAHVHQIRRPPACTVGAQYPNVLCKRIKRSFLEKYSPIRLTYLNCEMFFNLCANNRILIKHNHEIY